MTDPAEPFWVSVITPSGNPEDPVQTHRWIYGGYEVTMTMLPAPHPWLLQIENIRIGHVDVTTVKEGQHVYRLWIEFDFKTKGGLSWEIAASPNQLHLAIKRLVEIALSDADLLQCMMARKLGQSLARAAKDILWQTPKRIDTSWFTTIIAASATYSRIHDIDTKFAESGIHPRHRETARAAFSEELALIAANVICHRTNW